MPWYQPGATNGYSKFYNIENDPDRQAGLIVSDEYLGALLTAFRQAYVNAGGPDYEDTDSNLLDFLAANGVTTTGEAANLGRNQSQADIAAKQDYHPQSLAPGGAIPVTPAKGTPPVINTMTSGGDGAMFLSLDGLPTAGGSAAPNPTASGFFRGTTSGSSGGGAFGTGIPWLLIIAVAGAAYYFLKVRK